MTLPQTFRGAGAGGCAVLFAAFLVLPVCGGVFAGLTTKMGLDPLSVGAGVTLVALLIFCALYWFFGATTVVTVDRYMLTVGHQAGLGPLKGRLIPDYELPWGRVHEVVDLEKRAFTKNGNAKIAYQLVAGEHTVHAALFGTMHRDGKYLEFLSAVRAAVGDKLVRREDLGEAA